MATTNSVLSLPLAAAPPPGLQEATKNSTTAWQHDLEDLFNHAKDRFPDVVWELVPDENDRFKRLEEVWGHKAIIYARAPPSFQNRYFMLRPNGATSPSPYPSSPSGFNYPAESAYSLGIESSLNLVKHDDRTPSPFRTSSPSTVIVPHTNTTVLRLTTSLNPALFSDELEYLYTGKGFGEAFEFLFDTSESRERGLPGSEDTDAEGLRIDKLRKDLVFMWRSRLYSDVRIALTGNFGGSHGGPESTSTAIFSSHRFILVSRSPYFHTALLDWPVQKNATGEPPTLPLPSPPFTPTSLHFTLGFLYTGTLIFSHRTYDLSTAFAIMKASLYLQLPTLHDEIQARIVQEMCHGLFHAFIPFSEYENLTGGKWGTGGCRCRQCARRAPRVLEFALEDDVKNSNLERGARRALVGLFGEGWCTTEFAGLNQKLRESVLRGVGKRTTIQNVFPLLFAAEHALQKLGTVIEPWGDIVRDMVMTARKGCDELLCRESDKCFGEAEEWLEIMESGGVRFEDGERVEWVTAAIVRGVKENNAPSVYQTLVSAILLRPHPTDTNEPFLPTTSQIHVQVEQTRIELLKYISKRWLDVRQQRGFDPLEGWALKEISDHIEVPIDDLLNPPSYSSPKGTKAQSHMHLRPISNHPHTSKVDTESSAPSSMRASVLTRSMKHNPSTTSVNRQGSERERSTVASSSSSILSVHTARSTASVSTLGAGGTPKRRSHHPMNYTADGNSIHDSRDGDSPARRLASEVRSSRLMKVDRPDSKLTPSIVEPEQQEYDDDERSLDQQDERTEESGSIMGTTEEGSQFDGADEEQESNAGEDDVQEEDLSSRASTTDSVYHTPGPAPQKTLITRASLASVSSKASQRTASARVKPTTNPQVKSPTAPKPTPSIASSIRTSPSVTRPGSRGSQKSGAIVVRSRLTSKPTPTTSSRPSSRVSTSSFSSANRPLSTVSASTATGSSSTFKTASAGLSTPTVRSRRTSTASTASVRTTGGRSAAGSPVQERKRRISGASVSSVASTAGSTRSTTRKATAGSTSATPVKRAPSLPVADPSKLSPATATSARTPRSPGMQTSFSAGAIAGSTTTTPKKSPSGTMLAAKKSISQKKSTDSLRRVSAESVESSAKKSASSSLPTSPSPSVPPTPSSDVPPELPEKDVEIPKMVVDKENIAPGGSLLLTPQHVPSSSSSDTSSSSASTTTIEAPVTNTSSTITIKPKSQTDVVSSNEHKKSASTASAASIATLKKKGSTDTIKTIKSSGLSIGSDNVIPSTSAPPLPPPLPVPINPPSPSLPTVLHTKQPTTSIDSVLASDTPTGATLDIGIPCIISSKRKRFKAYARYIGEVIGENGPWVGVEVPMPIGGDSWDYADKSKDDRQWNDGTWGGIRYFEIGGIGSEWGDYGAGGGSGLFDERAARRRRLDGVSGVLGREGSKGMLKRDRDRETDSLSISSERLKRMRSVSPAISDMSGAESLGLFVRPQQVLYVVDAVGSDL